MPTIKVYHNPNFLDYRGQDSSILLPARPLATIQVAKALPLDQTLEIAYQQSQHLDAPWWENEGVLLHVRSTSVGDVLEVCPDKSRRDAPSKLFVIERMGFRPLQQAKCTPGDLQILSWDEAQPGDLVGNPDTGLYRVIARKLRPKWRARRLLAHVPNAQIWLDSQRTWALLLPINGEVKA